MNLFDRIPHGLFAALTAAAPLVHRSQSAVSMQLLKLEDAVGRPVLSRGPRHLELTDTGRELLPHARRLLADHAEALRAISGRALSGRVRLGVPDDYAARYLTPVLKTFAALDPAKQQALQREHAERPVQRSLAAGRPLDAAKRAAIVDTAAHHFFHHQIKQFAIIEDLIHPHRDRIELLQIGGGQR